MANEPTPKSFEQIFGDMFATYQSKIGVNDVNAGSAVTSFFEAVAQSVYRASGDTFSILRDFSVDRATGEALKRIAKEENLPPETATVATGTVTIGDSTFSKIATKIYVGAAAPNIGSTVLKVSGTTGFPSSGSIYIGRGTANIEGPIAYSSITVIGSFSQINLDTPITKYHNTSETVILAQGGTRNISVGEVVKTVGKGSAPEISFTVTKAAVLLDGEDSISGVPVAAQSPGKDGNVPRNSIVKFQSVPFTGATVTNTNPFTNAQQNESDEELRIRIKDERLSKGLGTPKAIKTKTLGATTDSEDSVITSNEIFYDGNVTRLFVDNGEGLEEQGEGVGIEYIVDSALGGEQRFQLATGGRQTGIIKATLKATEVASYDISPNDRLAILVGGVLSEHVFNAGDFKTNGFATAYEVTASVNSNSNLAFSARTIDNGTGVSFHAKEEVNEFLQVTSPTTGTDSAFAMGLPRNELDTLKLYKNNQLLSRNGRSAILESANQSDWANIIADGDTLILSVDGTAFITYTFNNSDFLAEGAHTSVNKNNSLQSWVNVINAKAVGVTASINGTRLVLTSNLGASTRASVTISSSSTLVTKGMFTANLGLSATGLASDYTLSTNTGQLKLTQPLAVGDSLAAGSELTEGVISSSVITSGSAALSSDASMWFLIDEPTAEVINHGVISGTTLDIIDVSTIPPTELKYFADYSDMDVNPDVGTNIINLTGTATVATGALDIPNNPGDGAYILLASEFPGGLSDATISVDYTSSYSGAPSVKTGIIINQDRVDLVLSVTSDFTASDNKFVLSHLPSGQLNVFFAMGGVVLIPSVDIGAFSPNSVDPDNVAVSFNSTAGIVEVSLNGSTIYISTALSFDFTTFNSSWMLVFGNSGYFGSFGQSTRYNNISIYDVDSVIPGAGNAIRIRSSEEGAFVNTQAGDYFVLWSQEVSAANRIEGRVFKVGTDLLANDYFEVKLTATELASIVEESSVPFLEGLSIVRTSIPPQKVKIGAGTYALSEIATEIDDQLLGGNSYTENDEIINVATNNKSDSGSILLLTRDAGAKPLSLTEGDYSESINSQFAFFQSSDSAENSFPSFFHSTIASDRNADTPDAFIPDFESDSSLANLEPNQQVCWLDPYGQSDSQPSKGCTTLDDIVGGTTVEIDESPVLRRLREDDRFYLLNPLDFDYNDSIIAVLDKDTTNKTFPINLYRKATTNTTQTVNPNGFRAYDTESGSTTEFQEFFGSTYSFKNYKALMQAKNAIDPSSATDEDAILFRSSIWGKSGEYTNIGYSYPTQADQDIAHTISVTDKTRIKIFLKSGPAVANNIDASTQWDVTINTNTPVAGVDEVTYTYTGTGTAPAMGTLAADNYITIKSITGFSAGNTGTFRIELASATSFTVYRPGGVAVAETGINTSVPNGIFLYENDDTTAQEIVNYTIANLSPWISAEILDDNGSTGAGVINKSTYEDNNYVANSDGVGLLDGINWIASSNLAAVAPLAQFTFKRALTLDSFNTNTVEAYAFNNGEEVRLIPTTITQLKEFFNILAVTGFITLGNVDVAERTNILQLSTQLLGSNGAIEIAAGTGNASSGTVIGNTVKIANTEYAKANVLSFSTEGINSGSWLKIESSTEQKKNTGISETTQVTIIPNSPTAGVSTITLANRENADIYFGQPKNAFRDRGISFKIEPQGSLVCISATGGIPNFTKTVEFNDAGGGNMAVSFDPITLTTKYEALVSTRIFSEVQPGDIAVMQNFADGGNNGTFVVLGISDDGAELTVDNLNGVDTGSVAVAPGDIVITTEIREGDTLEIAEPFSPLNQGSFRVIRRFQDSVYIDNPSVVEETVSVSNNFRSIGSAGSTFTVTTPGNMRITRTAGSADFSSVKMGDTLVIGNAFNSNNQGEFMVTAIDSAGLWVEVANALMVAEAGIAVSGAGVDVLEAHIPTMQFHNYNNTRAGDTFQITGNILDEDNVGVHTITEVLNKNSIVVSSIMTSQSSVQLNDSFNQVFVEEENPYVGYKKVLYKTINPDNESISCLLFDSNADVNKINQLTSTGFTAQSKLGFPTVADIGSDAYQYYTGLLGEVNRIIYGDPRDNITYPGVAAAGAEIYPTASLIRKIEMSINVRVQTGIPFNRIREQVRNNIAALINSSPIGQFIAISSIISTINSISGVTAVSITSPLYDPQNDVIDIKPTEKPFVLDVVSDIIVSKVD